MVASQGVARYAGAMINTSCFEQIGIIGSGRVARALALALAPCSTAPLLAAARSREGLARLLADGSGAIAADSPAALLTSCDLIAIAVSDDALEDVAAVLAQGLGMGASPFVFHVSGRSGCAVLGPLAQAGARTAAIHPAMTFTSDPHGEVQRMAGARFAITAALPDTMATARRIVGLLGGVPVEIAEDRRALYHAALCHAANHLVTLLEGSASALRSAGVEDPHALMAPLVRAAVENSLAQGFDALSGPLLRTDRETIGNHLRAAARHAPRLLPAYRAMALATLDELALRGESTARDGLRRDLQNMP